MSWQEGSWQPLPRVFPLHHKRPGNEFRLLGETELYYKDNPPISEQSVVRMESYDDGEID